MVGAWRLLLVRRRRRLLAGIEALRAKLNKGRGVRGSRRGPSASRAFEDGGRTSGIEDVPPVPEGEQRTARKVPTFLSLFLYSFGECVCVCREASSFK